MKQSRNHDIIEVDDQFYIRVQSSLADDRTRVLLHGDTFAVFNRYGDIQPLGYGQQGIFHREARHLSSLELQFCGVRPLLLSSMIRDDNVLLGVDMTNPDIVLGNGDSLLRGTVHIYRQRFLFNGACFDRFSIHNFGQSAFEATISLSFAADFADIFEVRGQHRQRRGALLPAKTEPTAVVLSYQGLDGVLRRTRIECTSTDCRVEPSAISVPFHLAPQEVHAFCVNITCEGGEPLLTPRPDYQEAIHKAEAERDASPLALIDIQTTNEQFNNWIRRSHADLKMMIATTPFGPYPYAGVPWFSTIFGRDGIITALELLWLAPSVARGVLSYLAATQARTKDPASDAEPGKILHETRTGEMARLHEVPFGRYYGSVDATPLFVLLAAQYYQRTADIDFLQNIWPSIEAALEWCDCFGDIDRDGFIEYARLSDNGLLQQGWKDSHDSVFHQDGSPASGPIALCEVQGYVYAARMQIADVAEELGMADRADALRRQATQLRTQFVRAFWSDELSLFAMALDGDKKKCLVKSSNAGQCLFSGIAAGPEVHEITRNLLAPEMFSGWGVRTIARTESKYNPMSYHNGSIWPHDNALIAWGVSDRRDKSLALRILQGLIDLSHHVELHRLPELICGFDRRVGKGPTLYPVACSPQAWAAGSVFMVLQACLGIRVDAKDRRVYLSHAALPESVPDVCIRGLRIGDASVDLALRRRDQALAIEVLRRTGDIEVVTVQ